MYIAMYKSIDSAFWCAYCKAKLYRWLKMLSEHGVCLLTGIQCTKEAGLEITRKITPYLQETYYGGTSEVKVVENPINVAYSSHSLEAHMDVGQYESQPGLSIFQCVRFDECVEGGESIVVDLLAVMERLRVTRPHHFATLIRVPATFFRIHYKRSSYAFDTHTPYLWSTIIISSKHTFGCYLGSLGSAMSV
jgi:hypothetical protein